MYFHFWILHTFGFIDDLITINNKWWWWWMMIMNWFCGIPDRRKTFSLIYSLEHRQRSSPSHICDTLRVGFEAAKNLSSGLAGWSCAVVKIEHFQKNIQYIYKISDIIRCHINQLLLDLKRFTQQYLQKYSEYVRRQ